VFRSQRLRRRSDGTFDVRLPKAERSLLRALPGQVSALIASGDLSAQRIFPPAYTTDETAEKEYRELMGQTLLEGHRNALEILQETADSERIDSDQAAAWLRALNDLRLVIGTRLDITEEEPARLTADDPGTAARAVYDYLSWLQEMLVDCLSGGL
jgi:hypothetical protein